jgi:sigma-B regulation protein RsbU (phosphoserine phosphatase)
LHSSDILPASESVSVSKPLTCERQCDDYVREARLIQSSLIPTASLLDYSVEIAFRFTPFSQVGGDFLDFFYLPDGLIALYLGDVVGKGLPAAMYGALVMGTLRGIHKSGTNTADILSCLNLRLLQRPLRGRFCSTLYAVFDPATRLLTFANAGLPFPLHASATACPSLNCAGFPSGMLSSAAYDDLAVQLAPGDTVLFATDGLHESLNPEGIEFSSCMTELWAECRTGSAAQSLDHIFDGLRSFTKGIPPHDDITAVALKVLS